MPFRPRASSRRCRRSECPLDLLPQQGRTGEDIDRHLYLFILIGRLLPGEVAGPGIMDRLQDRNAGPEGFELLPVRHMDLGAAAEDARVLLEGRLEKERPERRRGA